MLAKLIGGDGLLYNKWYWDATTNKYICFSVFLFIRFQSNHFTQHTKIHTLSRTWLSYDFCLSGFVTKIKFLFAEIVSQTQSCTFFINLFLQDFLYRIYKIHFSFKVHQSEWSMSDIHELIISGKTCAKESSAFEVIKIHIY